MRPTAAIERGTNPGPTSQPTSYEIYAQVARVIASSEFAVPERACQFLRYVVKETLEGRGDRIKAYAIAIEVFGRDGSFDAQNDPVVRIEAGRLRRALERYYLVAGQNDSILITIAKGGYVPTFALKTPAAAPAGGTDVEAEPSKRVGTPSITRVMRPKLFMGSIMSIIVVVCVLGLLAYAMHPGRISPEARSVPTLEGPVLVVAPFVNLGDGVDGKLFAAGMTEEIIAQLARFKELSVLGRETSAKVSPIVDTIRLREDFGVRFAVEGAVRILGNRIRVTSRLIDVETGLILWSQTYNEDLLLNDILSIEQDVAQRVAIAVAQPNGIIFRSDLLRADRRPQADMETYGCTLRYYAYHSQLSSSGHETVRTCLEQAVSRFPEYATAWAMLAYVYLDEMRFGFNPRSDEPSAVRQAAEAARTAVRLDPDNVRGLQASMTTLFFSGKTAEAMLVGERAMSLNPNDTDLLGEYGTMLAQSGQWQRGSEILERALALNPANSGFHKGTLALAAYMLGDIDRAIGLIEKADLHRLPLYHAVAAIIYAERGTAQQVAESRMQFLAARPRFFDDLEGELVKRGISPADRVKLTEGARKAGFPVRVNTSAAR